MYVILYLFVNKKSYKENTTCLFVFYIYNCIIGIEEVEEKVFMTKENSTKTRNLRIRKGWTRWKDSFILFAVCICGTLF
jgi:hypothetical protein